MERLASGQGCPGRAGSQALCCGHRPRIVPVVVSSSAPVKSVTNVLAEAGVLGDCQQPPQCQGQGRSNACF